MELLVLLIIGTICVELIVRKGKTINIAPLVTNRPDSGREVTICAHCINRRISGEDTIHDFGVAVTIMDGNGVCVPCLFKLNRDADYDAISSAVRTLDHKRSWLAYHSSDR